MAAARRALMSPALMLDSLNRALFVKKAVFGGAMRQGQVHFCPRLLPGTAIAGPYSADAWPLLTHPTTWQRAQGLTLG